jgi:hypothetical protein
VISRVKEIFWTTGVVLINCQLDGGAQAVGTGASLREKSDEENSRRPQPDEMRSIFTGLGLGGDFGDPQSGSFG